jgi:flotillin
MAESTFEIHLVDQRKKTTAKSVKKMQVSKISVSPFDFPLNLQAMTLEKLQFALPAVFTIGPDNELDALKKYALLLSGNADGSEESKRQTNPAKRNHVQDIVKGIIEGETRVIVSSMTMEEIFKERQVFKAKGESERSHL